MSHKVVLKKKWKNNLGKEYPIGQIIIGTKELADQLIASGMATTYDGEYPPKKKVKSDLFKPKN